MKNANIFTKSFAADLTHEVEVVKRLVFDLNTTYPYLLDIEGENIYLEIEKELSPEITTKTKLLAIQSRVYETLKSNEERHPDWYGIYHALHMSSVRKSQYAKQRFSELLSSLVSEAKAETYDKLLVPASGKFFEFPSVLAQLNPSLVVAKDIDYSTLEFTRGMFEGDSKLVLEHSDLSKKQYDRTCYDAALFIHPHVTNYDKLSDCEIYRSYDSEFHIPYIKVKEQNKIDYISGLWIEIILNSLSGLKVNGYAFFIFYEHRELDIVTEWLSSFSKFKVIHSHYNENMIDFAFSRDYLEAMGTEQENTANYVVMGAYRAGLLVQKVK